MDLGKTGDRGARKSGGRGNCIMHILYKNRVNF